jgi:hypothetical protein
VEKPIDQDSRSYDQKADGLTAIEGSALAFASSPPLLLDREAFQSVIHVGSPRVHFS